METLRDIFKTICQVGSMLLLVGASVWFGWMFAMSSVESRSSLPVPTIEQIQLLVGANPDGKIGPETLAKWEKAVCDQYAAIHFQPPVDSKRNQSTGASQGYAQRTQKPEAGK